MAEEKTFSEQLIEHYPKKIPIEFLDHKNENDDIRPKVLDNNLPDFDLVESHERCTLQNILDYYSQLESGNGIMNVYLEGEPLINSIRCYHCKITVDWVILCECGKYMCSLCWPEKTEEQAIVNGSKKWKSREESLKQCFAHKQLESVQTQIFNYNCDICKGEFSMMDDKNAIHCRFKNLDICSACLTSEKAKKIIALSQHPDGFQTWFENKPINLGNLPDFVPIMKFEEHLLLYNINPDSKHYHRIMLNTSNDHGRTGYYMVKTNLQDTIELLNQSHNSDGMKLCDDSYASPIPLLAQNLGFKVYLG